MSDILNAGARHVMNCPQCGAAAEGRFCSQCGGALVQPPCAQCQAKVPFGARFCPECGAPTGAATVARRPRVTPARVAGAAAVMIIVAFGAMQLGIRTANTATSAPNNAGASTGSGGLPDITDLSPQERASRLYDRMMRLHEERKTDSVSFFAPMALASYAAIPDMDAHTRYDMARIAMVAGALPIAQAQADTILRSDSTHLLGLILAADLARSSNDMAKAAKFEAKFVAQAERERARNLPEYQAHDREITSVLDRLQGKR